MWSIWRQEIIQIPYLYIDRTSMTHSNVKFVTKNSKWRKCEEHEGKKLLHEMRFLERERTSMTYSNANTFAASMSVICYLHLWMSSMDDIHGWHFCPWVTFLHPWMIFLYPWMTSKHDTSRSMDDIQGWHFHQWMRLLHPWMESSLVRFLAKIVCIIFFK